MSALVRVVRRRRPHCDVLVVGLGVTLAAIALASCTLETAPSPTEPTVPGTSASPRVVNVVMRDYLFEPDPIVLVPGETVRFNVVNAGLLAHEFVLGDAAVQAAWAKAEAAATPPGFTATPPPVSLPPDVGGLRLFVESGATATADYTVPDGQLLELACQIPGHIAQGMVGSVELRADELP
ncbi:MAG TPA: hypothetical protein VIF84_04880 [Candidatus Limnocylindrales bacterium]|jgi:uncharacterized cupredoxin-like copper-binding protein